MLSEKELNQISDVMYNKFKHRFRSNFDDHDMLSITHTEYWNLSRNYRDCCSKKEPVLSNRLRKSALYNSLFSSDVNISRQK